MKLKWIALVTYTALPLFAQTNNSPGLINSTSVGTSTTTPGALNSSNFFDSRTPGIFIDNISTIDSSTVTPTGESASAIGAAEGTGIGTGTGFAPGTETGSGIGTVPGTGTGTSTLGPAPISNEPTTDDAFSIGSP